jgi:long-subunit fatty acid transport protein
MLAVRAGVSYESNGQDPAHLNVTNYQLGRTGLHVGATWRIAGQTDFSVAYAHFIQRRVALTVNPRSPLRTSDPDKYHVVTGKNDGVAGFAIADAADAVEGPLFANAGTFYYHLDVVSVSLAQHF